MSDLKLNKSENQETSEELLWTDRKRWTFLGLPFTFTKFFLYKDRLKIHSGFLSRKYEEVRMYRILDVSCQESLWQRIFGLGTLHIKSTDKSLKNFDIVNIKNPTKIYDLLSETAEREREAKRVSAREYMGSSYEANDSDDSDDLDE